jgi:hypothetical protein
MRSTLCLGILAAMASAALAQSMEDRKRAKLAEPWLKNAEWIVDYDKARKEAELTGKPIFAYFTRSYAP